MNQASTKRCPFCAEEILAEAVRCKHCKSDIGPTPAIPSPGASTTSATDTLPAPVTNLPTAAATPLGQARPAQTANVQRWVLAVVASFLVAAGVGAFANGIFKARDAGRAARELGYGLSGRDVMEMERELGGGTGCTGGGTATFFLVWGGGAFLLGTRRRRGEQQPAVPTPLKPVFIAYSLGGVPAVGAAILQQILTPRGGDAALGLILGAASLSIASLVFAAIGAALKTERRKLFANIWLALSALINLVGVVGGLYAFTRANEVAFIFQALAGVLALIGPLNGRRALLAFPTAQGAAPAGGEGAAAVSPSPAAQIDGARRPDHAP